MGKQLFCKQETVGSNPIGSIYMALWCKDSIRDFESRDFGLTPNGATITYVLGAGGRLTVLCELRKLTPPFLVAGGPGVPLGREIQATEQKRYLSPHGMMA